MEFDENAVDTSAESAAPAARPNAPPIESRFLFVDVAAMRAKQLRRGAVPRLAHDGPEAVKTELHKAERVAMEEVRRGLVLYEVPGATPAPAAE